MKTLRKTLGLLLASIGFFGVSSCADTFDEEWLVINYWAIWCAPCREEIPELNELAADDPGRVRVLGVNFDAAAAETHAEHVKEMGVKFESISHEQAESFGIQRPSSLPATYLIHHGELKKILHGPQTKADIYAWIDKSSR